MSNPFKIGNKPIVQFQEEAMAWDRYKREMPHFFELASQREKWMLFDRLFYEWDGYKRQLSELMFLQFTEEADNG